MNLTEKQIEIAAKLFGEYVNRLNKGESIAPDQILDKCGDDQMVRDDLKRNINMFGLLWGIEDSLQSAFVDAKKNAQRSLIDH